MNLTRKFSAMLLILGAIRSSAQSTLPDAVLKDVAAPDTPRPWHTTDLYWELERGSTNLTSLAVTFTVDRTIPETCNLYIAPMGGQHLNNIMFYGGLQSNINGWEAPDRPVRVHRGRGSIFSRWGGEPVDISAARPEPDGLCESAGYEGHFASVRRPVPWTAGTYTWEIRALEKETIDGKPHTWFGCFLTDHQNDKEVRIGALRFEGDSFSFNGRSTSFVEIYATSKIPRSPVPDVSVWFEPPVVNGKPSTVKSVGVYHPRKGSPGAASPPLGRARMENGRVHVELKNVPFEGGDIPPERYRLAP